MALFPFYISAMAYGDHPDPRAQALSLAGAVAGAVLVMAALLLGLRQPVPHRPQNWMTATSLIAPIPASPQPEPTPRADVVPRKQGAAAAPNRHARPTAIVAPPPVLPPPTPPVAATQAGDGSAAQAGAAPMAGPGSGAGGRGDGLGAGRGGDGTGGGGGGSRARLLSGAISDRDYPAAAARAAIGGTVMVRFTVGTDGRARECGVMRSSGNADLDAATCHLIQRRFRYAPARDAAGRAVESQQGWRQDWWLEPRAGSGAPGYRE
jgi:protein TonB